MSVTVRGWVNQVRKLGGIVFLEVIGGVDAEPITVVVKKGLNSDLWELARKVKLGSAVEVKGEVPERSISRRGKELHPVSIRVLSEPADVLPLDPSGKTNVLMETLVNFRYVALRMVEQRALFRIRARLVQIARDHLVRQGFLEVHTPKICGAGAEGGATVFTLDYFGRRAYLAQSPQLYKQMLMAGLERVFEVTPYFRAEKFSTVRHLNESWGVDAEMGFIESHEDVMKVLEGLVYESMVRLRDECKRELEVLGVDLEVPRYPFKRVTYDEALEILKSRGVRVEWGDDLDPEMERELGRAMEEEGYQAYFIVDYPWDAKPFYIMREGKLSKSFDLDYRGLELASGGQREHRYDVLIENMRMKGLNPEDFTFYLEAFKYGMPPHGGFGLGLDRWLMVITGRRNIREVVLFPRDRQRLVP